MVYDIDLMLKHVDILQVGTRNMANYSLLKRLGEVGCPILLKRGLSATFSEWLQAAEYLLAAGNEKVILCERGIRTYSNHSRNTLDLNVVPLARERTHLPVVVDPSHGVGDSSRVRAMSRAAMACGAQGLLLEVHTDPSTAYSDGQQTVDMDTLQGILRDRETLSMLADWRGHGEDFAPGDKFRQARLQTTQSDGDTVGQGCGQQNSMVRHCAHEASPMAFPRNSDSDLLFLPSPIAEQEP